VRGLVIGRFQPLHKGHQSLIQAAIEDCVNVVVGVGSANAKQDHRNPFTFEERKQMILSAFPGVEVVPLPDIHDPTRWADHVLSLTGAVNKVYGNKDRDLDLFVDGGVATKSPGLLEREKYEGTRIRALLAEDDPEWRKLVPPPVVKILDSLQAASRIRLLEARA
jgi:nicotinamide-nucleotide adenylyltransferase